MSLENSTEIVRGIPVIYTLDYEVAPKEQVLVMVLQRRMDMGLAIELHLTVMHIHVYSELQPKRQIFS